MEVNELLDVIGYGIRYYRSEMNTKFTLFEYYAFTDLKPAELAKVAQRQKGASARAVIRDFDDKHFWDCLPLKIDETLDNLHIINNKELTREDKELIIHTLVEENYPLLYGVYCMAARCYVNNGVESITKEAVRDRVLKQYNKKRGRNISGLINDCEKPKMLIK